MTLPLSACGKNNISTDNSQKLQSESSQEYDDGRDAHMIPAGESQTTGESQKAGVKKNVQDNNINSELPSVSIVPESTAAASSDAVDKDTSGTYNASGTDSTGSGNDKTENRRTDPIELPFVPAY